jgi:hypothetical protein
MAGEFDDLVPQQSEFQDLVPQKAPPSAAPAQEPGWLDPGSTSGSYARGFANTASLGIGKWVNGIVDAAGVVKDTGSTNGFWDNVKASVEGEKANNAAAFAAHPLAYMAGGAAAIVPAAGATAPSALGGITLGTMGGAISGASEHTNAADAEKGAAIGAGTGLLLSGAGAALSKGTQAIGEGSATGLLQSTYKAARKGDSDAVDSLRSTFGISNETSDHTVLGFAKRRISELQGNSTDPAASQTAGYALSDIASNLAPSRMDVAKAAIPSMTNAGIGAGVGAALSGGNPIAAAGGALVPSVIGAGLKLGQREAMQYAGSPATRNTVNALTPAASAPMGGAIQPSNDTRTGLQKYTDQFWSNF